TALAAERAAPIETLSANLQPILAALRLTVADADAIRTYARLADRLTLSNLSALHRYATLARGLRISVRDLLALCEISREDPFASGDPHHTAQEQTARFIALARKIPKSGFSIALLDYIYRHRADLARGVGLRPEDVITQHVSVRAELLKLAENAGTRD